MKMDTDPTIYLETSRKWELTHIIECNIFVALNNGPIKRASHMFRSRDEYTLNAEAKIRLQKITGFYSPRNKPAKKNIYRDADSSNPKLLNSFPESCHER
jgi:hypothetical protein